MRIRPAVPGEGVSLQDVERDAGRRFAEAGLGQIAEDAPTAIERFERAAGNGLLLVTVDGDNHPVAFALLGQRDAQPYLEEFCVRRALQGRGIGRALLAAAEAQVWNSGEPWLTLETFREISWNGPWYRSAGYEPVPEHARGPELRADLERTAARWPGLPRIQLRKRLAASI